MSALKPMKQARMEGQSQVTRTESVALLDSIAPERDHLISTPGETQQIPMKDSLPSHPKGHKVRAASDVWKMLDEQPYLRVSDTFKLNDVWVQPLSVIPISSLSCSVRFMEIIVGQHIKYRIAEHKLSVDDLCKMLYLGECLSWDLEGQPHLTYDDWIADMTACFVKEHGVSDSHERAKVCNYIITEKKDFTFYPGCIKNCGIFFRKTCVHSYPCDKKEKIENPTQIKCCAVKGKFEYIFESRLIPLPNEWWDVYPKDN